MKSIYIIGSINTYRFIIRNLWLYDIALDFPYASISHVKTIDRFEFKIGIMGFCFVLIKVFKCKERN
jgi:hypothetical protein